MLDKLIPKEMLDKFTAAVESTVATVQKMSAQLDDIQSRVVQLEKDIQSGFYGEDQNGPGN